MRYIQLFLFFILVWNAVEAQVLSNLPLDSVSIGKVEMRQENMGKWHVVPGDYSGITYLGGNQYAVVSDKEPKDGFIPFTIEIDLETGKLLFVERSENVMGSVLPARDKQGLFSVRDCEGIAFFPERQTLFIAGEGDQQILEYDKNGMATGLKLNVPLEFGIEKIHSNYGFESLTYSPDTHLFWTTTESQLIVDGKPAGPANSESVNLLRLQSFGDDLQPKSQYAYRMDRCKAKKAKGYYAYGVSELLALPDGKLLVLEREFYAAEKHIGSYVQHKIYQVNPSSVAPITFSDVADQIPEEKVLKKTLVTQFKTELSLDKMNLANFEGMCLGPRLIDGRQVVILISDSQHNYGNSVYHLKDYLRVLIF